MGRLIDADALLKKFCVNSEGRRIPEVDCDNYEITVSIKDIKRIIREQPTSYDIEKVVAELEEESDYEPIDYDYCDMSCSGEEHFIATDKAIDIVRKGGME